MGLICNGGYLRDSWNILDIVVVASSWVPAILYFFGLDNTFLDLGILRTMRILRPLKSINSIK